MCDLSKVAKSFAIPISKAKAKSAADEGEHDEEEKGPIELVTIINWTRLSDLSTSVSARYLHSSFSYMVPQQEGCDVDPCLYLTVFGGLAATGQADPGSGGDTWTCKINQVSQVKISVYFSISLSLYLYTSGILCNMDWCIRQAALMFFYHITV